LTKTEHLRQQLRSIMANLDNLETILGNMRNGTNKEATMVLGRLRLGAPIEEVVQAISTESMHCKHSDECLSFEKVLCRSVLVIACLVQCG
jgi:hypothetical protein